MDSSELGWSRRGRRVHPVQRERSRQGHRCERALSEVLDRGRDPARGMDGTAGARGSRWSCRRARTEQHRPRSNPRRRIRPHLRSQGRRVRALQRPVAAPAWTRARRALESPDATAHGFDLEYCTDLACAPDGTLLGLLHDRVLRWTHDGRPIPTWPPKKGIFGEKHEKLRPLFRPGSRPDDRDMVKAEAEYPDSIEEIKHRPTEMRTEHAMRLRHRRLARSPTKRARREARSERRLRLARADPEQK